MSQQVRPREQRRDVLVDGQANGYGTCAHTSTLIRLQGRQLFVQLNSLLYLGHINEELDLVHQRLALLYWVRVRGSVAVH